MRNIELYNEIKQLNEFNRYNHFDENLFNQRINENQTIIPCIMLISLDQFTNQEVISLQEKINNIFNQNQFIISPSTNQTDPYVDYYFNVLHDYTQLRTFIEQICQEEIYNSDLNHQPIRIMTQFHIRAYKDNDNDLS
jgi:hypothetical protein